MIREYKTSHEISGPLMVVERVQGVTYDELAEIELSDGSIRRCKVLEVNGDTAVVQLFEIPAREVLGRAKSVPANEYKDVYAALQAQMEKEIAEIGEKGADAL